MMEKIKANKYAFAIVTLFVLLLFFICWCSPLNGDDWGNYIVAQGGFANMVEATRQMYISWEGRIVSRILIYLLTYHNLAWIIVNTLFFVSLYMIIIKLVGVEKEKKNLLLSLVFISFFAVENTVFTQTYIWRAGGCTYFFPMVLLISWFLFNNYIWEKEKKLKAISIIFAGALNFIASLFVENIAVMFVIANFIYFVYYYLRYKKNNMLFLVCFFCSLIGFLIMYMSPGTVARMLVENPEFNNLNVFNKIIHNIPNFVSYTFINNSFLILLGTICMTYMFLKEKLNKCFKIIFILYINILTIFTVIAYLVDRINSLSSNRFEMISQYTNYFYDPVKFPLLILAWTVYGTLFLYLCARYFKNNNLRDKQLFLIAMAFLSNAVMLISPIWGARTSVATVFILYIVLFSIINTIKISDKIYRNIQYLNTTIIITITIIFSILYNNIRMQQISREQYIRMQLHQKANIIEIIRFPDYALWNSNPINDFHINTFKIYYNIPLETEIVIVKNNWKW